MSAVLEFLSAEAWTHFVFALLHTLWQAPVAVVLLAIALRRIPAEQANRRYAAALATMGALLLAAMVTWSLYRLEAQPEQAQLSAPASTLLSASVTTPLPSPASPHAPDLPAHAAPGRWTPWLAALWLLGSGLGLLRAGRLVRQAGRVRRHAVAWNDPAVERALATLTAALEVTRRVRVAVSPHIDVPGVVGLLRPVVVFPVAVAGGIPAAHLDAILAHELAHIRRYDYWANLFQLLVEALLFFNPAVWWISRRIRIEREACCDALAAKATGLPAAYASALAAFAEDWHFRNAQPTLAMSGREEKHVLLDRVKRLVVPGYRPRFALPWYTCLAALVAGAAVLAVLSQGVYKAVTVAADILTPAERVRRIQAIEQEYPPLKRNEHGEPIAQLEVSGAVRTEDGAPLPEGTRILIGISSQRFSEGVFIGVSEGRFAKKIAPGTVHIGAEAEGYAFSLSGPFQGNAGENLDNLDVVLRRGASVRITAKAIDGTPIPGASISGSYQVGPMGTGSLELVADENGVATLSHYEGVPVSLLVVAEGYARERHKNKTLRPEAPFECILHPALPTTGIVTAAESGQPLAGVRFLLLQESGPQGNLGVADSEDKSVDSDAQGRFALNSLRDDTLYTFRATDADGRKAVLEGVTGGQSLNVSMQPPIRVRGRVVGDVSLLAQDGDRPVLGIENSVPRGVSNYEVGRFTVPVEIREGEGFFETDPLWPGRVKITAGPKLVTLEVDQAIDDLVIDLASDSSGEKRTRTVVLRLVPHAGLPTPEGFLSVNAATRETETFHRDALAVVGGEARIDVPAPSTFGYRLSGVVGYWAPERWDIEVPEGAVPLVVNIPVEAAGAVHGRVLSPDGSAANALVTCVVVEKPDGMDLFGGFNNEARQMGGILFSPLPFGLRCAVVAWDNQRIAMSDALNIDEVTPIHDINLQFVPGEAIRGRLVDEHRAPVTDVGLRLDYSSPYSHSITGLTSTQPGDDGRFVIEGVNFDVPGQYRFALETRRKYAPFDVAVDPGVEEQVITVRHGLALSGRVVDADTGAPVPGALVQALETPLRAGAVTCDAEGPSGADGEFRFSNLAPGTYQFSVDGGIFTPAPPPVAGSKAPVVIKLKRNRNG